MMYPKPKKRRKKKKAKVSGGKYGKCELTGIYGWLEPHHIFNGNGMRYLSEKYGAVVYITAKKHNYIHKNAEYRKLLKAKHQERIMKEQNWTKDQFYEVFKKNYL